MLYAFYMDAAFKFPFQYAVVGLIWNQIISIRNAKNSLQEPSTWELPKLENLSGIARVAPPYLSNEKGAPGCLRYSTTQL